MCQNIKLSSFGIFLFLTESPNDQAYSSILLEKEKQLYESIINIKKSFSSSLGISNNFFPENTIYWDNLYLIISLSTFIALFAAMIIIIYLFLRFGLSKCSCSKKYEEVNNFYLNFTWFLFLSSSVIIGLLIIIIYNKSNEINISSLSTLSSVNNIVESNKEITEKINNAIESIKKYGIITNIPNKKYMENFNSKIRTYITESQTRTNSIIETENYRNFLVLIVSIFFIIVILFSIIFLFLYLEKFECLLEILSLICFPFLLIFEGNNLKNFFFYSDICESVHKSLYQKEMPIAGQSLGYYYNCFTPETRAKIFNIRFKLYDSAFNAKKNVGEVINIYEELNENVFESVINCESVLKILPLIENGICKNNLKNSFDIVVDVSLVIAFWICFIFALRRIEIIILKKKIDNKLLIKKEKNKKDIKKNK